MLLNGDYATIEAKKTDIKTNVKIGDRVMSKEHNKRIYEGVITKVNTKTVSMKTDDGRVMRINYYGIDKIIL